jgi:hypothetical protein
MIKRVPLIPQINKRDQFVFLLVANRLGLLVHKDVKRYIVKHFFYDFIFPIDRLFYSMDDWTNGEDVIYQSIKTNNVSIVKIHNNDNTKIGCGIANAYALGGYSIIMFSKTRYDAWKRQTIVHDFKSNEKLAQSNDQTIQYLNSGQIWFFNIIKRLILMHTCDLIICDNVSEDVTFVQKIVFKIQERCPILFLENVGLH